MPDVAAIRAVHIGAVFLSIALFALRGGWMIADSPLLGTRFARVVPHVVDTVLLAAGIALSVLSQQYPLAQPWLTAKIGGLLLYIGLGTVALKPGRSKSVRLAAFVGALLVVAWIVATARCRCVWP
jgi:uncharacterized membrane protein SirB2